MRFENADFKMTKEMIQIVGGSKKTEAYLLFAQKAIQGYLAVRRHAKTLIDMIYPMYFSGLPCFKVKSMDNLMKRLNLHMDEAEAAHHMASRIEFAHDKWTTNVYDQI